MKIAILSPIWPGAVESLRSRFDVVEALNTSGDRLHKSLEDANVVVLRSGVRLDREELVQAKRLRLIVRAGMGLEAIDLATARERGIRVVCIPLSARSVAEHVIGLLLALWKRVVYHDRQLRRGVWSKHQGMSRDLYGKNLGILGFGRIGIATAELARAFGMTVQACDRSPGKPHKQEAATRMGVRFLDVDSLFSAADAVAITAPLDESTRGLVDARLLERMKPDAVLINVGRGAIVDPTALAAALASGRLAGAALDVFAEEPPGSSPLFDLENFVGTPHVGAQSIDAQEHIGAMVVQVIEAFAKERDLAPYSVEI